MQSSELESGLPDEFTFLVSDVSISWVYLLVQMSLWQPLYLQWFNVRCCRCSFCNCCICTALIFIVADTFFETDVSATYFSLNLQMLFSLPIMYNCICILHYLGFKDTSFANFTSTSHVFDNVRMLLIEILHPQLALSMLCGYSSSTFCIFNSRKPIITDIAVQYPLSSIYFTT